MPEYKKSLAKAGRSFDGVPFTRDICIGRDRDDATSIAREALNRQWNIQKKWQQPGENYNVGIDELMHDRLIVGNAQECTDELIRDHEEFGSDFLISVPDVIVGPRLSADLRTGGRNYAIPLNWRSETAYLLVSLK